MGSSNSLLACYIYRDGDPETIRREHARAIGRHESFDWEPPFAGTDDWSVEVRCWDNAAEMTGLDAVENHRFSGDDGTLDLYGAPFGRYYESGDHYRGVDDHAFTNPEAVELFADLVGVGYEATDRTPLAASVVTPPHSTVIHANDAPPFTAASLARGEYEHFGWITVFPPPVVETYGRERLLSAPAFRVTELDEGAVLLVAHENPHEPEGLRAVAEHIGLEPYTDAG